MDAEPVPSKAGKNDAQALSAVADSPSTALPACVNRFRVRAPTPTSPIIWANFEYVEFAVPLPREGCPPRYRLHRPEPPSRERVVGNEAIVGDPRSSGRRRPPCACSESEATVVVGHHGVTALDEQRER